MGALTSAQSAEKTNSLFTYSPPLPSEFLLLVQRPSSLPESPWPQSGPPSISLGLQFSGQPVLPLGWSCCPRWEPCKTWGRHGRRHELPLSEAGGDFRGGWVFNRNAIKPGGLAQ